MPPHQLLEYLDMVLMVLMVVISLAIDRGRGYRDWKQLLAWRHTIKQAKQLLRQYQRYLAQLEQWKLAHHQGALEEARAAVEQLQQFVDEWEAYS